MVTAVRESVEAIRQSKPLNDLVPWLAPWDEQTVLCKDGALMALYAYHPKDHDGQSPEQINAAAQSMERAFMNVRREDCMMWFMHERRKSDGRINEEISNSASETVLRNYMSTFSARPHFQHDHYLAILLTPARGSGKFMETFAYHLNREDGLWTSAREAMKEFMGVNDLYLAEMERIADQSAKLEQMVEQFRSAAGPLGRMQRLSGPELWGWLNRRLSVSDSGDTRPIHLPRQPVLLDSYLGTDTIDVGTESLRFSGATQEKHVAAFSIKNDPDAYPESVHPDIMDGLYEMDCEWLYCVALRMTNVEKAKNFIKAFRNFYNNTQRSLKTLVSQAVTNVESEQVNVDAEARAGQTNAALRSFATGNPVAAYANITLLVFGDTKTRLDENVKSAAEVLSAAEFLPMRERQHLLSAWAGTLPGQWALPVRWVFLTGAPMADLIPVRGIYSGEKTCPYLTEQTHTTHAALTVMETAEKAAYYFNFHVGDLGHALIIGPSRSGKSSWFNFLIYVFRKYPKSRVFVLDKDKSNYITTLMNHGTYLDYGSEEGLRANPMKNLDTDADWDWFGMWVDQILSAKDGPLISEESKELGNAITRMKVIPPELRTLAVLGEHFSGPHKTSLQNRLSPWIGNGIWSKFFSAKEDGIALSDYTTIAMDEILNFPEPARAFMTYLFYRIEKSLDGLTPTLIYIEEAWFAFEDPVFAERLKQWLKRLAKKLVIIVMATQSAFEAAESKVFASILDNVPTLVLLPHAKAMAFKDFYKNNFQLEEYQVKRLTELTRKKDYYVVQDGVPKEISCRFSPDVLAYVRSDGAAREMFDRWKKSGDANWRAGYVQEAQRLG